MRPFEATISPQPRVERRARQIVLTCPPASSRSARPAEMSQGFSRTSQNPSNRPAATYARSIAAEPSRRTARARQELAEQTEQAHPASCCTVYGKPVQSSASISVSADDTRSGAPLSHAPAPRSAVNSSRRFGS